MKMEIDTPDVAVIAIQGPTQCGKTGVAVRIKEVLESEYGATVVLSQSLRGEVRLGSDEDAIGKTVWLLSEHNQSRG